MEIPQKIRVLIVGGSPQTNNFLNEELPQDPQIEVVGATSDIEQALFFLKSTSPNVMLLDTETLDFNGINFLEEAMLCYPVPTIVLSSPTQKDKKIILKAVAAGAIDVLLEPSSDPMTLAKDLQRRIKIAFRVNIESRLRHHKKEVEPLPTLNKIHGLNNISDIVIAIGASAGGVSALSRIIPAFPKNTPCILIVQHMPSGFTRSFADRLNHFSAMRVKEAEDNDLIRPGLVLVAPGGEKHMTVQQSGKELRIALTDSEKVSGHRPSVDALFFSIAQNVTAHIIAVLLTGMGADGAKGMKAIRSCGGYTLAQDEQTSVVFGMPGAAWQQGAAQDLVPLDEIPSFILNLVKKIGS